MGDKIKRYEFHAGLDSHFNECVFVELSCDGEWVRHEDHVAAMNEVAKENQRLRKERDNVRQALSGFYHFRAASEDGMLVRLGECVMCGKHVGGVKTSCNDCEAYTVETVLGVAAHARKTVAAGVDDNGHDWCDERADGEGPEIVRTWLFVCRRCAAHYDDPEATRACAGGGDNERS